MGTGVPYLIDKALGLSYAIFASVACVAIGGVFLLAGHRHKEGDGRRRKMGEIIAFIAALSTLVILSYLGILKAMPKEVKTVQDQPRIRILDVVPVPMSKSGAAFPAMNIYYDIAGAGVITGVASRFAAGFGGQISDEAVIAEQDKLLQWDGWKAEMARRRQFEMHAGDPGEFTSIPNMEGKMAEQFRANWEKVAAGTIVLHVFITFKFFEPSGRVGVSENCFWFSGGFARHDCGRGRTFEEQR